MSKTLQEYVRPLRKSDKFTPVAHTIRDQVLIGDWGEVQTIPVEQLRKWTDKPEELDGLIIKGYEMKWDKTNENGERYEKAAFDEFIQRYFVDGKMNMPVDINHEGWGNWKAYCGKVLYIEVNSVGFYFVVYIPRSFEDYDLLKWRLQAGIVQGFSKEGFVGYDDYEYHWNEDGTFDYEMIKKMSLVSVSLVCTPANGLPFEKMQETKNALIFANNTTEPKKKSLSDVFNK